MSKRLGPRFGREAGFLIGVAAVLGLLELPWPAIAAAMAIAWLLVAGVELALARRGPAPPSPQPAEPARGAEPKPVAVAPPPVPREAGSRGLEPLAREDPARHEERSLA